MFDTKIAVVLRDDPQMWQKLNVTAFLMSGITAAHPEIIGAPYRDRENRPHCALSVQPVIVLAGAAGVLRAVRNRANARGVETAVYIEEMLATGHDAANRAVFAEHGADGENTVGVTLGADKKVVDKITKGARMHVSSVVGAD